MKQKCCTCKEPKDLNLTNFYRSKTSANGFGYECKPCIRKRAGKYKDKYQRDADLYNMFL